MRQKYLSFFRGIDKKISPWKFIPKGLPFWFYVVLDGDDTLQGVTSPWSNVKP